MTSEYQTIYQVDNSSVSLQIGPSAVQSTYTITYDSENNQIMCTSTSGSGTGGSTPDDTWAETEIVLRDVFIPRDIISLVTSSALVVRK